MDKQFCSIVIPVHNSELTIERTLASLISNKDYIHEIIIVDDGCIDKTLDQVNQFMSNWFANIRIIAFSEPNKSRGPGPARQAGLDEATGEFITFLDSDDCLTPSSLRYVYEQLQDKENTVLLHTQTIYYESGNFDEQVEYSDYSCGGNFYKLKYLKDHKLHFHPDLWMAEDEFFNDCVITYLEYLDPGKSTRSYYKYPVYEVHHDTADKLSFALGNWIEYSLKYHLLYVEYWVREYVRYPRLNKMLKRRYTKNLITRYYDLNAILQTENEPIDKNLIRSWFKKAIQYFEFAFMEKRDYIIQYYKKQIDTVQELKASVEESYGIKIKENFPFEKFIREL